LQDRGAATVVIKIDRAALDPAKLVLPYEVRGERMPRIEQKDAEGGPYVPTFIPRVEAWYRAPISRQHFRAYLVVRKREDRFVQVPATAGALDEIERLGREWAALDAKANESDPWSGVIRALMAARDRNSKTESG